MAQNKLVEFNPKKIGKDIISAAIAKHKDKMSDKVVGQVEIFMERIQVLTLLQQKTERQLTLCRDQLEAINKGHFTIQEWNGLIRFDNNDLNIPWDQTGLW